MENYCFDSGDIYEVKIPDSTWSNGYRWSCGCHYIVKHKDGETTILVYDYGDDPDVKVCLNNMQKEELEGLYNEIGKMLKE